MRTLSNSAVAGPACAGTANIAAEIHNVELSSVCSGPIAASANAVERWSRGTGAETTEHAALATYKVMHDCTHDYVIYMHPRRRMLRRHVQGNLTISPLTLEGRHS